MDCPSECLRVRGDVLTDNRRTPMLLSCSDRLTGCLSEDEQSDDKRVLSGRPRPHVICLSVQVKTVPPSFFRTGADPRGCVCVLSKSPMTSQKQTCDFLTEESFFYAQMILTPLTESTWVRHKSLHCDVHVSVTNQGRIFSISLCPQPVFVGASVSGGGRPSGGGGSPAPPAPPPSAPCPARTRKSVYTSASHKRSTASSSLLVRSDK